MDKEQTDEKNVQMLQLQITHHGGTFHRLMNLAEMCQYYMRRITEALLNSNLRSSSFTMKKFIRNYLPRALS
jgi:hypothetical protein